MPNRDSLTPKTVWDYFYELSAVPRGSGNTAGIAEYCEEFARRRGLRSVRDQADNVVIFKPATPGYEAAEPILLQGHLDMVCQKEEDCSIDFLKDGIQVVADGAFLTAKGTTLGADNGIAVAMVLSILDSEDLPHPALEAVFTSDEEIGMIGAGQLDAGILTAKRMINLDSEEEDAVTVSCAGGSEIRMTLPLERREEKGTHITLTLGGLQGGHSGVEIHRGRVNADMLAGRFLWYMAKEVPFHLIGLAGGDKSNAIPRSCQIDLCVEDLPKFEQKTRELLSLFKRELSDREPELTLQMKVGKEETWSVFSNGAQDRLLMGLLTAPNGVQSMSAAIEGLVETSLNLGVLYTQQDQVVLNFSLRSNKVSALSFLEEKLTALARHLGFQTESFGQYPPWEFRGETPLLQLYKQVYREQFGADPRVEAIHAGLECGVFAGKIADLDCIAIGPQLYDVHTTQERLSISSTERIYRLLVEILKRSR